MARQQDALGQFTKLFQQLTQERDEIRSRLVELDAALGGGQTKARPAAPAAAARSTVPSAPAQSVKGSGLGMREAIQHVTTSSPLPIRQIVEAMQQIGYKFKSSNPVNSVGAYLYGPAGKKHFRKSDAGFSPLRGGSAAKVTSPTSKPAKRKLSAAGRRAIAEGARKRWAAYNAKRR